MNKYLILGLLQILFIFNLENVPDQEVIIDKATENTKPAVITFFTDDLDFDNY